MEDLNLWIQIAGLMQQHAWPMLAAVAIGGLVRASKGDLWERLHVPPRWRPALALVLGCASAAAEAATQGVPWQKAAVGGVVSAAVAVFMHELFVEGMRGGREIGAKKNSKKNSKKAPDHVSSSASPEVAANGVTSEPPPS